MFSRTALLVVTLLAVVLSAANASAQEPTPDGVANAATVLAGKAGEQGSATCRRSGGPEDTCNSVPVGRHASARAVDAHESSWTHRALGLQYELAGDLPFRIAPWVGTHNSANSTAYDFTLSRSDSNQQLSMYDQLRVDARSLELDIHWVESRHAGGQKAPVMCHGTPEHVGCTSEFLLEDALAEIAAWLEEPGNEREVLLLYLEDHIRDAAGYDKVAADLEAAFGDRLYRSPDGNCSQLPLSLSRADVLAAGAQVVNVASGCGGGEAWRGIVFDWSGPVHVESRPRGFGAYPDCHADFGPDIYASRIVRYFEDSTFVTATASNTPQTTRDDGLTPETTREMVRCGVDLFGFDQFMPGDGRHDALVWSWAEDEPSAGGECAVQRAGDGRWEATRCVGARPAACRAPDGDWAVTRTPVQRRQAPARCAELGAAFAVPRTGNEAELLRAASAGAKGSGVWLDYELTGGGWTAGDAR